MNLANAWRFMVAARDNPVLAAWAFVFYRHKIPVSTEVSPYEAWDAYQSLFNFGLVTPAEFDDTDVKRTFFSSSPNLGEIQQVVDNIQFLCPEHDETKKEIQMPKSNNSFFPKSGNALATRSSGQSSIQQPRRQGGLGDPFSNRREILPEAKRGGLGVGAFSNPSPSNSIGNGVGMECRQPEVVNKSDRISVGDDTYQPWVHCGRCGDLLTMTDEGTEILPGDGDVSPGALLVAVFAGKCHRCGLVHHSSVASDPYPEAMR